MLLRHTPAEQNPPTFVSLLYSGFNPHGILLPADSQSGSSVSIGSSLAFYEIRINELFYAVRFIE